MKLTPKILNTIRAVFAIVALIAGVLTLVNDGPAWIAAVLLAASQVASFITKLEKIFGVDLDGDGSPPPPVAPVLLVLLASILTLVASACGSSWEMTRYGVTNAYLGATGYTDVTYINGQVVGEVDGGAQAHMTVVVCGAPHGNVEEETCLEVDGSLYAEGGLGEPAVVYACAKARIFGLEMDSCADIVSP